MPDEPKDYKYFAFISYSRKDSKVAAWLQKRLEWFRFPVKLVPEDRRPPHDRYVRPIYRDKTNLEVTDEHYWQNIRRALEESRYLIVLCSPNSAKPRPGTSDHPVDMEVAHFLMSHGGNASLVAPIILGGNVTSDGEDAALCPALRSLGDTLINRNLPTMVPDADTLGKDAWESGFVSQVSYLLQLERSAIGNHLQRESTRQANVLRRWLAAVLSLALLAVASGLYSLTQKREAEKQKSLADQNATDAKAQQALSLLVQGVQTLKREDPRGLCYIIQSLTIKPENNPAITPLLATLQLKGWPMLLACGPELDEISDDELQCSLSDDLTASIRSGLDSTLWRPALDGHPFGPMGTSAFSQGPTSQSTEDTESVSVNFPGKWEKKLALNPDESVWVNDEERLWMVCCVRSKDSAFEIGPVPFEGDVPPHFAYNEKMRCLLVVTGRIVSRSEFGGGESILPTPTIYSLHDTWFQPFPLNPKDDSNLQDTLKIEKTASLALEFAKILHLDEMDIGGRTEFLRSPDSKWISVDVGKQLWLCRPSPARVVKELSLDWAYRWNGKFVNWSPNSRYLVVSAAEECLWESPVVIDLNDLDTPIRLTRMKFAMEGPHLFSKDSHWLWSDSGMHHRLKKEEFSTWQGGSFLFDLPSKGAATSLEMPALPRSDNKGDAMAALNVMRGLFQQQHAPAWLLHMTEALLGWKLGAQGALTRLENTVQLMSTAIRELHMADDSDLKRWGLCWLKRFEQTPYHHKTHADGVNLEGVKPNRLRVIAIKISQSNPPILDIARIEAALTFKIGSLFTDDVIESSIRTLYGSGLIENLDITAKELPDGQGVIVEITIKTRKADD